MKLSVFHLVLFSTIVIALVEGQNNHTDLIMKVLKVRNVQLKRVPYHVNATATSLLGMQFLNRRDNCMRVLSEIKTHVLYSTTMLSTYVPTAHLFEIDGEDVLAVRCASLPAVYLSSGPINNSENGSVIVRILDPPVDQYRFNFEIVHEVRSVTRERYLLELPNPEKDPIYMMDVPTRVRVCAEATKFLRYHLKWNTQKHLSQPTYYYFLNGMWTETYFAFMCNMITMDGRVTVFIRSDHSKASSMLTIVLSLEGGSLSEEELNVDASVMKYL